MLLQNALVGKDNLRGGFVLDLFELPTSSIVLPAVFDGNTRIEG
jgi:hypothetical protein